MIFTTQHSNTEPFYLRWGTSVLDHCRTASVTSRPHSVVWSEKIHLHRRRPSIEAYDLFEDSSSATRLTVDRLVATEESSQHTYPSGPPCIWHRPASPYDVVLPYLHITFPHICHCNAEVGQPSVGEAAIAKQRYALYWWSNLFSKIAQWTPVD